VLHPTWLPNGVVVGCAPETQRDSCDKLDKLAAKLYKLAEVAAESIAVKKQNDHFSIPVTHIWQKRSLFHISLVSCNVTAPAF